MEGSPAPSVDSGVETRRHSSRNQSHPTSPSGGSNKACGGRLDTVNGDHVDQPSLSATGRPSRRTTTKLKNPDAKVIEEALRPLTDEERNAWKGWCELESDPALFNYILREYGVQNIKIQEVLGLEDDMLQSLPKPVHGLVFLFEYRDEGSEDEKLPKCPNHVWFANQTTHNACATIALLNIVMNIPRIDLGENLKKFKEETRHLKPAYRGRKLDQNGHIRALHNSFVRRMDILNADLSLSNDIEAKKKRKRGKRAPKSRSRQNEDMSFHFIAFVPVRDVVWRLDGMQRQPVNLGSYERDWISIARANIYQSIGDHDGGLQFNLLALCQSPLASIPNQLAQNIKTIRAIEEALSNEMPDWRSFDDIDDATTIRGPCEAFGISPSLLQDARVCPKVEEVLGQGGMDTSMLLQRLRQLVTEQRDMRVSYTEEVATIDRENVQAARRKEDHTPLVYRTIRTLAEKGILKDIMNDVKCG
ncbi:hypothetical protein ACMFMG_004034 [Clarireedia jacksonii]